MGNKDWLRWIRAWRVNGLADFKADPFDPYTQVCVGSNYRMSDLHAALGVSQISNVEQILGHRKALATTYLERLKNIRGVKVAIDDEGVCNSSNHLFIVHFESSRERANVYRELIKKGVKASFHYKPIPLVTGQCSRLSAAFEGAESYHQRSMSLPIHLNMTAEDAIFITEIMVKALETRT